MVFLMLLHVADPERGIDLLQMILIFTCSVNRISLIYQLYSVGDDVVLGLLAAAVNAVLHAVNGAGAFQKNVIIKKARMAADPPYLIIIFPDNSFEIFDRAVIVEFSQIKSVHVASDFLFIIFRFILHMEKTSLAVINMPVFGIDQIS